MAETDGKNTQKAQENGTKTFNDFYGGIWKAAIGIAIGANVLAAAMTLINILQAVS